MRINVYGYDVDNDFGMVLEGDDFTQGIWTFPVGVTFSKDIKFDSGWNISPGFDFSVIPATGDIKAKQDVLSRIFPASSRLRPR